MLTAERNRLPMPRKWTKKGIQGHIRMLERLLVEINREMDDLIKEQPHLAPEGQILAKYSGHRKSDGSYRFGRRS